MRDLSKYLKSSITYSIFLLAISLVQTLTADSEFKLPKPLTNNDFIETSQETVTLGQLLFFDPILSGNKNISCATCHHPTLGTSDGVSLSTGDGGIGLGTKRRLDTENMPEQLIGRNAPALFNLGAKEFTSLFHDGRLQIDNSQPNGIRTPLGADMMQGFTSLLSAQAMFPMASPDEMAGHYNENEISTAIRKGKISGKNGAWNKIAKRLQENREYVSYFISSSNHIRKAEDIKFTDIANALAEFIAVEWKAVNSPFDSFIRGNTNALAQKEKDGLKLFYGKAGCAICHSGTLQTDHKFHAIGLPQFGPGKVARFESRKQDTGRMRVTGKSEDAYKFRTPSLRNIALTAPYGHNGAYKSLRGIIKHHLDPEKSLKNFQHSNPGISDTLFAETRFANNLDKVSNQEITNIGKAIELPKIQLNENEIDSLVTFLSALTDRNNGHGKLGKPKSVPSQLDFD